MGRPEPSSHRGQSNAATAIALFGLVLIGAALLGLMALVLPQLLGIVVVILIFAVPAAFHYLVWGWWLSQMKDEQAEDEANAEDGRQRIEDRG
jgi:hypothetical protein